MTTPTKNSQNMGSPYARPIQQYPSQSQDFLSLEFGGPHSRKPQQQYNQRGNARFFSTPAKHNEPSSRTPKSGGASVPYFYQNPQPYRGGGGTPGNFFAGNRNRQRFGGNQTASCQNFQQQDSWFSDKEGSRTNSGGGRHNNRGHRNNFKQRGGGDNSGFPYFHFTMLEDPWKDLVERRNAIHNSKINFDATGKDDYRRAGEENDEETQENKTEQEEI